MSDSARGGGLPDWVKTFLPPTVVVLLAGAAWAAQWGQMTQAAAADRASLAAVQAQLAGLANKVDTVAAGVAATAQANSQDERRLGALERAAEAQSRDSATLAGQLGEMRGLLTGLREDQRAIRALLEGQQRRASLPSFGGPQ